MEQTFKQIGKSYAVAAAEIGCSKPALVGVVKHNHWPKKDAAGLREKLKQFFKTNGAVVPDCLDNEKEAAEGFAKDVLAKLSPLTANAALQRRPLAGVRCKRLLGSKRARQH